MRAPRIVGSTAPEQPEAGMAGLGLDGLTLYTASTLPLPPTSSTPTSPTPASPAARFAWYAPAVGLAVLAASLATLGLTVAAPLLAGDDVVGVPVPTGPVITGLQAAGRTGTDTIACPDDTLTIAVTAAGFGDGVVAGWLESGPTSLAVLLYPEAGGYTSRFVVEDGVLHGDGPGAGRLTLSPGQRLVLRVHGLAQARVLVVAADAVACRRPAPGGPR